MVKTSKANKKRPKTRIYHHQICNRNALNLLMGLNQRDVPKINSLQA